MPEFNSAAHPYSQAVFELARDSGDLDLWSRQLECLALISEDAAVADLAINPHVSRPQLTELVLAVGAEYLDSDGANLVRLLVRNGRLSASRTIAEQYEGKRAEAEKVIAAELITAAPVDSVQQQAFSQALEQRLGRSVKLKYSVDQKLIGGAVIRAGDWVVDGSVRAQLDKLVGALGV